jgi:intracellular multiplication protein IcmP
MSGQKNEPDAVWTMLFLVVVLILGFVIFWHVFRIPILEGLRWVRLGELWFVGLFTHQQDACFQWLRHAKTGGPDTSPEMIGMTYDCFGGAYIASLPNTDNSASMSSLTRMLAPSQMVRGEFYALTGTSMGVIEQRATGYLRWPLAVVFTCIAIYVIYFSPRNKFRTRHTLESFIKMQATMWPVINPIADFNPIKSSARIPGDVIPDKLPLFAEALSPEEWISFHRIPVTNGVVDREAARRALLMQLGPRWNGIEGQAPYLRALFAAFALKSAQKRDESDDFLGKIALCWNAKTGFRITPEVAAEVDKILGDPKCYDRIAEQAALHAYRTTAMVGALRFARSMGGVLAPGQFVWLRGTDRNLWYALNNLGRRTFHSEGMGALAHFMAEQAAKKPLPVPRVDTAIVTVNQFLSDPEKRSIPIPPREGDDRRV